MAAARVAPARDRRRRRWLDVSATKSNQDPASLISGLAAAKPEERFIVLEEDRRFEARPFLGDQKGRSGARRYEGMFAIIWHAAVAVAKKIVGQCRSLTPMWQGHELV